MSARETDPRTEAQWPTRLWVLGAADPEMARIEALLRELGERVVYALTTADERVHADNAYADDLVAICAPRGTERVYLIECDPPVTASHLVRRIDHHRPGDTGYGRPPEEFLPASLLGQVISELAKHGAVPDTWPDQSTANFEARAGDILRTVTGQWGVVVEGWERESSAVIPEDLVYAVATSHSRPGNP